MNDNFNNSEVITMKKIALVSTILATTFFGAYQAQASVIKFNGIKFNIETISTLGLVKLSQMTITK